MTSQKDQIQALITEIDGVLQKTTPRLPWVVSGEITQQRQVLERVRNYLVTLQRRQIAGEGFGQAGARPDLLAHDIYYQPVPAPYLSSQAPQEQQAYGQDELNAQQMLQAIVQEMGYLRSSLMQPLQADLEGMRQQRETLAHEIRQLEAQRQGYVGQLPGQQQLIAEFLQALMSRLQETLPQQVAQTLSSNQLPYAHSLTLTGSAPSVIATSNDPSHGLGNIQVPQAPADELLIRLDSTLSVVFESLQRNVQSYQESLSQGLDKMHSMGQQGEMMFTALISHLAEQLGRETSSYLQPAMTDREPQRSFAPLGVPTSTPLPTQPPTPMVPTVPPFSQPGAALQPFTLPFPGTEMADPVADASPALSIDVPMTGVDTAIDSWLRASGADAPPDVDLELAALNLEGFDLSQLAAQDVNALLELDATLLGTNLPSQPLLSPTAPIAAPPSTPDALISATTVEDTADIDAALKLLEQLSSELQQPSSMADADAQLDRMLSSPTAPAGDTLTVGIPDDARDELDEFYESLFGTDAIAPSTQDTPTQAVASATATTPQPAFVPTVEPLFEPAVAPSDTQPLDSQPSETQLSAIQPSDIQPISLLPAETQLPAGALAEPTAPAPPATSTVVDPTLGWHLPSAPLITPITQLTAEPEIPEALLEDELLDGWDFADAEMNLAEPATTPATDDLLGGWVAPDDRASFSLDAPSTPVTDASPTTETALFGESQDSPSDAATDASPELALPLAADPVSEPGETGLDEINTLTDLFGDTAFGEIAIAEELSLEPAIADALPPAPNQPLVNPPTNLTDGYLADDRYTPASPDEDLLSLDEPIEALDSELWLDESTLSRLSEDLFNLEEAIDETSPMSYSGEPDATTPAFFADTTALSESASAAGETTLGDWGDASLDDFAANLSVTANEVAPGDGDAFDEAAVPPTEYPTLFPLESESLATAADPPGTFRLEGMDDLFANTPVVLPVTPIPPPVLPNATEPTASFTLEGMDDIFADSLISDLSVATTSTPTAEAPFTLEGVDDLFNDTPVSPAAVPATSTPVAEVPLTLEGVDGLNDTPVGDPITLPPAADQPLPFTLEGVDELFADMPPVIVPPAPTTSPAVFSFADSFSAELEAIPDSAPTKPDPVSAFTLEPVEDLFAMPAAEALVPTPSAESTVLEAPFTLERVGDLFIEVPSGGDALDDRSPAILTTSFEPSVDQSPVPSSTLETFALEQVGDLFVETLPEAAPLADLPEALPPSPQSVTSEPSALEQAFASLMGSFDETLNAVPAVTEPSVVDSIEATIQTSEKKKEMS